MILSTLRVVAEAGGLVAAGVAAGEVAPYLYGTEYEHNVEVACAPLVQQSNSLVAEFMHILRKLETSSRGRLTEMCCSDGKKRRRISKADIEELCANLVNGDMDLNGFPSLFHEADTEATVHAGEMKLDEKYRIVPKSEVAKLEPPSVDQTGAASSSSSSSSPSSSSSTSSWYRPSRGSGGGSTGAAGVRVTDVLCLMVERDRLSSDLLANFELQQQRVRR